MSEFLQLNRQYMYSDLVTFIRQATELGKAFEAGKNHENNSSFASVQVLTTEDFTKIIAREIEY